MTRPAATLQRNGTAARMRALRKRRWRGMQLFTVEQVLIERTLDAERTEHLRYASSLIRSSASAVCGWLSFDTFDLKAVKALLAR